MKKHQENLVKRDLIQKLGLSPIEKYEKFDKFPVTVFTNIALAVLTVLQVNYFTSTRNLNNSNQYASWNQLIYGSISDNNMYQYYVLTDIQKQIQQIFTNLNTQYSSLLNPYIIDGKTKANLVFYKKFPTSHQVSKFQQEINLQNGIDRPFNMNDTKSFKQWIQSIDNFYIYIEQIGIKDYLNIESQWNLMINYKVQHSYTIESYLSVNGYQIAQGTSGAIHMKQEFDEVLYFNFIILILSFFCIIKLLLRINGIIQLYMENRNISKRNLLLLNKNSNQKKQIDQIFQQQKSWNELSLREKWAFFDLWFIYNLFGHFIQLFTSISIISIHFSAIIPQSLDVEISIFYSWGIGLSSFFAITSLAQYLQYNPQINLIIDMIVKSFPRIFVEAFGFLPIVMAYIVLGLALFSNSERYSDINNSIITSFSLLLGDSIHDITIDLMANGSTHQNSSLPSSFAIIFVFTFVFTFMLAVQNIWIAIIMEELDIKSQEIQEKKKQQKQQILLQRKLSTTKNLGTGTGIMKIDEEDLIEEQNPFKRAESVNQYEIQFDEQNNLQSEYNFSSGNQDDFQEDLAFKIQDTPQKLMKTKTAPLELATRQPINLQKQNTFQRQDSKESQQMMSENYMLKKKLSVQAINQVAKKLSVSGQNIDNNTLIYSKQKIKQIFKHEQDQIEQKIQILEQINFLTQEIKFLVDQSCQDNKDLQIYNLTKDEKKNINKSYKAILSLVTRKSGQLLTQINKIL